MVKKGVYLTNKLAMDFRGKIVKENDVVVFRQAFPKTASIKIGTI